MRPIKHIALSIIVTLSVFGAVLYTSCTKEACKGVTCLNGGTCGGGMCTCPTGVGGNNCETIYRQLYTNSLYAGVATYYNKYIVVDSTLVDSTYVIAADTGNTLTFNAGLDSNYTEMQMAWTRPGKSGANATIFLSKSGINGSSFSVAQFPLDSFSCTGTGTINSSSVSMNIVATPPHSPAIVITLNNFAKR